MKIVTNRDIIVGRINHRTCRIAHVAYVIPCGTEVVPIPNAHPAACNEFGSIDELAAELDGNCYFDFVLSPEEHDKFDRAISEANVILCDIEDFSRRIVACESPRA